MVRISRERTFLFFFIPIGQLPKGTKKGSKREGGRKGITIFGVHLLSCIHSFNSSRWALIMCWVPGKRHTCFITQEGLRACEVGLG